MKFLDKNYPCVMLVERRVYWEMDLSEKWAFLSTKWAFSPKGPYSDYWAILKMALGTIGSP